MGMTRRGFLKFLTSIPAVAVIASVPEAVANLIVEQPATLSEEEELAHFYIGFPDGIRIPVKHLIPAVPEPTPFQILGGYMPAYAPTQRYATLSFATNLRGGRYIQTWMDEVRGQMRHVFRDCVVYEHTAGGLSPIATLRSVYPSEVEATLGTFGADVNISLIFQAVVLSTPIEG